MASFLPPNITFLPTHFNSVTWTYITPTQRRWKILLNSHRNLFEQSQALHYISKEFCTLVISHKDIKRGFVFMIYGIRKEIICIENN
jgi:hypothetical protein